MVSFELMHQVNHFGSFVRFFFNLPAPTDQIPAKIVLTTLDSAVHRATTSPCGPVHINCPFREPLESSPLSWLSSCLKGLDFWMTNADPFTKYIHMQLSHPCINAPGEMIEVLNLIQRANNGLLLFGAIHSEDEMWAALLLAKHLQWPVVADILSGLRLRKLLTSFSDIERNFIFVDNLDHALLSDSVKSWLKIDVVIQVSLIHGSFLSPPCISFYNLLYIYFCFFSYTFSATNYLFMSCIFGPDRKQDNQQTNLSNS